MGLLWALFILAGLLLCAVLILKIIGWKPNPALNPYISLHIDTEVVIPSRGDITDYKGRVLATSTIAYDINMDCKVPSDTLWNNNIAGLAEGLARILGGRTAQQWQEYLQNGRAKGMGSLPIQEKVTHVNAMQLRKLPIFEKGQNRGGYIETRKDKRLYPYGETAKRVIGYVVDNAGTVTSRGIEGAYDADLHGVNGVQVKKKSDNGKIPVNHPDNVAAKNGKCVRTTLDIDIQTIAERALLKSVKSSEYIEKACVIVLETKTGAVRAMANLSQFPDGTVVDDNNHAVLHAEAPGSVFKGALVAAMLDEGYLTSLDYKIPTHGGKWIYHGNPYRDYEHLNKSKFPSGYITVREAFEMSANNPFRQLLCEISPYNGNPDRFIKKVKSMGLFDTLSFDLTGIAAPFILEPSMKKRTSKGSWDGGTYPRIAIGYGMELSPLNLVTFYNAIANDGRMMKPYLVESVMDGDKEVKHFSPTVLREQICCKQTIDTLKRVMSMVTSRKGGTAYYQLKDAVCPIAGKTGTAQRLFKKKDGTTGYIDENDTNAKSHQGTFVGFFPVDNPKYTAIVVVWSRKSYKNHYGATYAAPAFREIADKIYCLNED